MFSDRDKIKELIEFFAQGTNVECLISQNLNYAPKGVSVVMTYKFDINHMEIFYNKWYVDGFELAQKMNLPGCEHHDQLVKGSGVMILSKKLGSYTFFGKDADDIIKACENGRDLKAYMLLKPTIIQK